MISHNPETNCTDARLYYYDFLQEENKGSIPEDAMLHIEQCRNCLAEIDRLKDLLVKADKRFEIERSRKDSAISTLLSLHFEYIGEPVKCDTVKPFLASLADPVLQIRIPTPITEHIDKCTACRNDLTALIDMHLPHKFLCRLGQIFAEKPVEDELNCSQALSAILAVVSMDFQKTNADVLEHLCTCPDCREQLYIHREKLRNKLLGNEIVQNDFSCESVSFADIYDYCLPYGIDPADDQYHEFRESLTSHFRKCPKCLDKMQQLHKTISNIAERNDSEIVTVYDIEESESHTSLLNTSEITDTEDNLPSEQSKTIGLATYIKKAPRLKIKPLLKIGLAAAAVVAIALALLFNSSPAEAVTFEQFCRAIEKAKNVCIKSYVPGGTEPIQTIWISRALNINIIKTPEKYILTDITNKFTKEMNISTGSIATSPLSSEMSTEIKNKMTGTLGLVPLTVLDLNRDDIEWNHVGDDLGSSAEAIEIYELTWTDISFAGNKVFSKWRIFVNSETYLPMKTEFYRKGVGESEYTLKSTTEVNQLNNSEIEDVIKKLSF